MEIDLSTLERAEVYATLIQSIIPRPVAWVLSENAGDDYATLGDILTVPRPPH